VRDFRQWTQKYVDYMHYTVPLKTETSDGFQFPSEFVGQYGVYEAVKHIYSKNAGLSNLLKEESLMVSQRYFATDLEKGIQNLRQQFREAHGISETAQVIFYAPGNEVNEAEFGVENVRKGIKEFLLKYSAPTSLSPKAAPMDNFVTIISLHAGSDGEKYIRDYMRENEWTGKVIFVSNVDEQHYDAMCASDMGIIYDGQMASSAVACHLPTMNMIKMRMHHQWYHDLFNRWWSDMNIVANNNISPELIGGEAWFGKIADSLAAIYINPNARYERIEKWDAHLHEAMSYKAIDRSEVSTRDIILADGHAYNEYKDPFHVAATAMWRDI